MLFSWIDPWTIGLPLSVGMGAVALIGYLFGHRTRKEVALLQDSRRQGELERATRIARQLETIASTLRQDLTTHHAQVRLFKQQLHHAQENPSEQSWETLCSEAESMLAPTMQLAHQITHAYDQIRQQSNALQTFTEGRTDPLTGVGNGRALEEQLEVLLNGAQRGGTGFSVALLSVDRDELDDSENSPPEDEKLLPELAGVIQSCMRDTDFVARLGKDEFVVVMPQTRLTGAGVFGDRLRRVVSEDLSFTISCGIAEALPEDQEKTLLTRADSSLYSAKAAGGDCQFFHTGDHICEYRSTSVE